MKVSLNPNQVGALGARIAGATPFYRDADHPLNGTARALYNKFERINYDEFGGSSHEDARNYVGRNQRKDYDTLVRVLHEAAIRVADFAFSDSSYTDYGHYVVFTIRKDVATWREVFDSLAIFSVGERGNPTVSARNRDASDNLWYIDTWVTPAAFTREDGAARLQAANPHLLITPSARYPRAVDYAPAPGHFRSEALLARAGLSVRGENVVVFDESYGGDRYVELTSNSSRGWQEGMDAYTGEVQWVYPRQGATSLPTVEAIERQLIEWRDHRLAEFRAGRGIVITEPVRPQLSAHEQQEAIRLAGERYQQGREKKKHTTEQHIPTLLVLPPGSEASRTWGIEVETGAARNVHTVPDDWDSKYDGSLSSAYDEYLDPSECPEYTHDPSNSEDDDYYDNRYEDCDYCGSNGGGGGGRDGDCREYVSPILRSVHSDGLRLMTDQLEPHPVSNTAGLHVHVGADGLTAQQVRELVMGYDAIEWLIEASYNRVSRGYCKRRSGRELIELARYIKQNPQATLGSIRKGDRYVTVNLNSLDSHGTIEFRAMGPVYNYDHLTAWATFCREMVNVAHRGGRAKEWAKVRDWAGVLAMFEKYGIEYNAALTAAADSIQQDAEVVAA